MYKYLIAFVLGMPLIGIWRVENGEFAMSVGMNGEPNGATTAFGLYAMAVALVAVAIVLLGRARRRVRSMPSPAQAAAHRRLKGAEFKRFSRRLLALNASFLLVMLFGFGGINVWLGTVEKGVFRATLGPLGGLAYLMTKFAVPAMFAYLTTLYMHTSRRPSQRRAWWGHAVLIFLVGSTWGFKSTGVFMMLPALLVRNWRLPLRHLLMISGVVFALMLLSFYWFDAQLMDGVDGLSFLLTRLTVLQGDVAWRIWGLHQQGASFPDYGPTLLAAFGDTTLEVLGVAKSNLQDWAAYHYDWIITNLAGAPLDEIANGHSVTATPFAEGLVAAGVPGVALFALLAGALVGKMYVALDNAIAKGRAKAAAMLATYFCFHLFAWLNGGAVTQLFHVSVLVYLAFTYVMIDALSGRHRRRRDAPPVAPDPAAPAFP